MGSTLRPARLRHPRHSQFRGLVRGQEGAVKEHARLFRMSSYLKARQVILEVTGTGQVFTADFANNEIDIVGHGLVAGDGPFLTTTDTTLPAGLVATTPYWVNDPTTGTLTLHFTREEAFAGINPVEIGDAGTGVHTLTPGANVDSLIGLQQQNGISFEQVRDETDIDNLTP